MRQACRCWFVAFFRPPGVIIQIMSTISLVICEEASVVYLTLLGLHKVKMRHLEAVKNVRYGSRCLVSRHRMLSLEFRPYVLIVLVITCMFTAPQSARFGLDMSDARIGVMGLRRHEVLDCDHCAPRYFSSRADWGLRESMVSRGVGRG